MLDAVRTCLHRIQELSGRGWSDVGLDQIPADRLEGFDSYASVEVTTALEAQLGRRINADTIFYDGKRALTLRQACECLAKSIGTPN